LDDKRAKSQCQEKKVTYWNKAKVAAMLGEQSNPRKKEMPRGV